MLIAVNFQTFFKPKFVLKEGRIGPDENYVEARSIDNIYAHDQLNCLLLSYTDIKSLILLTHTA